jgi:hypothetical protein
MAHTLVTNGRVIIEVPAMHETHVVHHEPSVRFGWQTSLYRTANGELLACFAGKLRLRGAYRKYLEKMDVLGYAPVK